MSGRQSLLLCSGAVVHISADILHVSFASLNALESLTSWTTPVCIASDIVPPLEKNSTLCKASTHKQWQFHY